MGAGDIRFWMTGGAFLNGMSTWSTTVSYGSDVHLYDVRFQWESEAELLVEGPASVEGIGDVPFGPEPVRVVLETLGR